MASFCAVFEEYEKSCGFDTYKHIPFHGLVAYFFRCGLTIFDYLSVIIAVGKFVLGGYSGSVTLLIGSFAFFLDACINYGLQQLIAQKGPKPCMVAYAYQMPASSSDVAVFFITGFLLFCTIYRKSISTYILWQVYVFGFLAMYKRLLDQTNTMDQLIYGALLGFVNACWMHAVLYYWLRAWIPALCDSALFKFWGIKNDTFVNERTIDVEELAWFQLWHNPVERDKHMSSISFSTCQAVFEK